MAYFSNFAWDVSSSKAFSSETKDALVGGAKGIAVKVALVKGMVGNGRSVLVAVIFVSAVSFGSESSDWSEMGVCGTYNKRVWYG